MSNVQLEKNRQRDRQTSRQISKRWQKHNLIGGGKNWSHTTNICVLQWSCSSFLCNYFPIGRNILNTEHSHRKPKLTFLHLFTDLFSKEILPHSTEYLQLYYNPPYNPGIQSIERIRNLEQILILLTRITMYTYAWKEHWTGIVIHWLHRNTIEFELLNNCFNGQMTQNNGNGSCITHQFADVIMITHCFLLLDEANKAENETELSNRRYCFLEYIENHNYMTELVACFMDKLFLSVILHQTLMSVGGNFMTAAQCMNMNYRKNRWIFYTPTFKVIAHGASYSKVHRIICFQRNWIKKSKREWMVVVVFQMCLVITHMTKCATNVQGTLNTSFPLTSYNSCRKSHPWKSVYSVHYIILQLLLLFLFL